MTQTLHANAAVMLLNDAKESVKVRESVVEH